MNDMPQPDEFQIVEGAVVYVPGQGLCEITSIEDFTILDTPEKMVHMTPLATKDSSVKQRTPLAKMRQSGIRPPASIAELQDAMRILMQPAESLGRNPAAREEEARRRSHEPDVREYATLLRDLFGAHRNKKGELVTLASSTINDIGYRMLGILVQEMSYVADLTMKDTKAHIQTLLYKTSPPHAPIDHWPFGDHSADSTSSRRRTLHRRAAGGRGRPVVTLPHLAKHYADLKSLVKKPSQEINFFNFAARNMQSATSFQAIAWLRLVAKEHRRTMAQIAEAMGMEEEQLEQQVCKDFKALQALAVQEGKDYLAKLNLFRKKGAPAGRHTDFSNAVGLTSINDVPDNATAIALCLPDDLPANGAQVTITLQNGPEGQILATVQKVTIPRKALS